MTMTARIEDVARIPIRGQTGEEEILLPALAPQAAGERRKLPNGQQAMTVPADLSGVARALPEPQPLVFATPAQALGRSARLGDIDLASLIADSRRLQSVGPCERQALAAGMLAATEGGGGPDIWVRGEILFGEYDLSRQLFAANSVRFQVLNSGAAETLADIPVSCELALNALDVVLPLAEAVPFRAKLEPRLVQRQGNGMKVAAQLRNVSLPAPTAVVTRLIPEMVLFDYPEARLAAAVPPGRVEDTPLEESDVWGVRTGDELSVALDRLPPRLNGGAWDLAQIETGSDGLTRSFRVMLADFVKIRRLSAQTERGLIDQSRQAPAADGPGETFEVIENEH